VRRRLTCSFGVAIGEPGENIDQILRKADSALYRAKRSGRNKVRLFDPLATSGDPARASLIRGANRIATPAGGQTAASVITA
jgi:predicted signal transduction protein with EAL and GGDEF domain